MLISKRSLHLNGSICALVSSLGFAACGKSTGNAVDGSDTTSSGGDKSADTAGASGGHAAGGQDSDGQSAERSGGGPSFGGSSNAEVCSVFPTDNAWNRNVSGLPVHANSANYVASIGTDAKLHPDFGTVWEGAPIGIPYILVDSDTPLTQINYTAYGTESDAGPFPLPLDAPVEGGPQSEGDRHVIAVDREACKLYELYSAYPGATEWEAAAGVVFDLRKNDDHPEGCTSADAAGLPIFPGLVRYDEVVEQGEIHHALRFTVQKSQKAYVYPARHYASNDTDPNLPPMGLRFRMRADFDCSAFSSEAKVVCAALKAYGMIVADNGSNWYLSGAPDERWNDDALGDLKTIPGGAFEVVDTGETIVSDAPDCVIP